MSTLTDLANLYEEYSRTASSSTGGVFILSNDSFCNTHLIRQVRLVKSILQISWVTSIEMAVDPVLHYYLSQPNAKVLASVLQNATDLSAINANMASASIDRFQKEISSSRINFNIVSLFEIAPDQVFPRLAALVSALSPHELFCVSNKNSVNLSRLTLRDFSLTYKTASKSAILSDCYLTNAFRGALFLTILTDLLLAMREIIPEYCIGPNDYTSSVLLCLAAQSVPGSKYRYYSWPSFALSETNDQLADATISEYSICYSYAASHREYQKLYPFDISITALQKLSSIMHSRVQGNGSHVYSKAVSSEKFLSDGDRHHKTRITLFTSSLDEVISQEIYFALFGNPKTCWRKPIFHDQQEWISKTVAICEEADFEIELAIRLHPRLGRDHRGLSASPHLESWVKNLNVLISSSKLDIKLILPEDNVSSYELGLSSDLCISAWSTIGLELAFYGKKVINVFNNCGMGGGVYWPITTAMLHPKSVDEYAYMIQHASESSLNHQANKQEIAKVLAHVQYAYTVSLDNIHALSRQLRNPTWQTETMMCLFYPA